MLEYSCKLHFLVTVLFYRKIINEKEEETEEWKPHEQRRHNGKSWTAEPLLRGHPDERPVPLERPLSTVSLNIYKCIDFYPRREATPFEKSFFWCRRVVLQEGGSTV